MKKVSLNLNISMRDLGKLKADSRYLFLAVFVLVLLFEFFVVKDAASMVLKLESQTAPSTPPPKGVRINFQDYNANVERFEKGSAFRPSGGTNKDPFNITKPAGTAGTTDSPGVFQLP